MPQWIKCLFGFHNWGQQLSNNFMDGRILSEEETREFCHGCFKMKRVLPDVPNDGGLNG